MVARAIGGADDVLSELRSRERTTRDRSLIVSRFSVRRAVGSLACATSGTGLAGACWSTSSAGGFHRMCARGVAARRAGCAMPKCAGGTSCHGPSYGRCWRPIGGCSKSTCCGRAPDRLWTCQTRPGVLNFVPGWIRALRWQRPPEMEGLSDFLFRHLEGIAASREHQVRFLHPETAHSRRRRTCSLSFRGLCHV